MSEGERGGGGGRPTVPATLRDSRKVRSERIIQVLMRYADGGG